MLAVLASVTIGLTSLAYGVEAQAPTVIQPVDAEHFMPTPKLPKPKLPSIYDEFGDRDDLPSEAWMERVAQCETGQDPEHIGHTNTGVTFRGAFGFYTVAPVGYRAGTWWQWGGWQFADYANQATYDEQKIIYIRVHVTGFHDPITGKFWPPAGYSINNCSRFAGPLEYHKQK